MEELAGYLSSEDYMSDTSSVVSTGTGNVATTMKSLLMKQAEVITFYIYSLIWLTCINLVHPYASHDCGENHAKSSRECSGSL